MKLLVFNVARILAGEVNPLFVLLLFLGLKALRDPQFELSSEWDRWGKPPMGTPTLVTTVYRGWPSLWRYFPSCPVVSTGQYVKGSPHVCLKHV